MSPYLESFGLQYGPFLTWLLMGLLIFLRYAVPASLVFFLVYHWRRKDWFFWKIQQKFPKGSQIRSEIGHSLMTSFIFAAMAIGIYALRKLGFGAMYFDIAERGVAYYLGSIVFMIFAHDAYFYWTHRLMHHPRLFRLFHLVHHRSVNPTPYTSFSFHPLEAIVEFGIVPIIALFIPMHPSALLIFTLWSIAFNILGHTGYEMSPAGFTRHWLFKWINTPTHHNMHHEKSRCNYSLYFNIWDRLMGTNHPDYDAAFERIKARTTAQRAGKNTIGTKEKVVATGFTLLFVSALSAQISMKDLKDGHYGTPEARATQTDAMMQEGLSLRPDQQPRIKDVNLKYARRTEEEVVRSKSSRWTKYYKLMSLQKEKDAELRQILTTEQFEKYAKKRDAFVWEGAKAMLGF